MEVIHIEPTDDTPGILLDANNGIYEIWGRSLPEDASQFYQPVLDWIEQYKQSANTTTQFVFKLEYFNTASSKFIQDVLIKLSAIKGVQILWYYREDDEDMEEMGKEYMELVDVPFELRLL
jgi:hypothetical protein